MRPLECLNLSDISSSLKMCVCAYLCKQRGLSVHLHLYISGCVIFYCVTSLWAKPLRNTESPHLDAMKNISLPLSDGCCQQLLHQLCVHSHGTNVVLFGPGDVSQVLSQHGAVHFLHQKPTNWSASCVITWELWWICSAAVVSCCCCECKLSYQFKARQRGKAIYVACFRFWTFFSFASSRVDNLKTKLYAFGPGKCRCMTQGQSAHPLHSISITFPLLWACRALEPEGSIKQHSVCPLALLNPSMHACLSDCSPRPNQVHCLHVFLFAPLACLSSSQKL